MLGRDLIKEHDAEQGYPDQFGGEKDKKMGYKRFKEKLLEIHTLPMDKQRDKLLRFYNQWRRNNKPIDDVCVMGVKF